MKKYFLYEVKKNAYTIICLTVIAILLYAVPVLTKYYGTGETLSPYNTNLGTISLIGGLLAVVAAVWLFSYRMKKRSVDMYYSLPVSHTKILGARFLLGLVAIFVPYTISFWLGGAMFAVKTADKIMHYQYYIPQFFASIPAIFCIYAIASFVFTRANNIIDGLIFIIFWTVALSLLASYLREVLPIYENEFGYPYNFVDSDCYAPYAPLIRLTEFFQNKLVGYDTASDFEIYSLYQTIEKVNMAIGFTVTGLMAIGSTVGLFLMERFTRAENVGQTSESWFGYKIMIPLLTALCLGLCDLSVSEMYVLILIILIASLLMTVLYKRTIKLSLKQILIFIAAVVIGIILATFNSI